MILHDPGVKLYFSRHYDPYAGIAWLVVAPAAVAFVIRVIAESGLLYTLTSIAIPCAMFTSDSPKGSRLPPIITRALVCLHQRVT